MYSWTFSSYFCRMQKIHTMNIVRFARQFFQYPPPHSPPSPPLHFMGSLGWSIPLSTSNAQFASRIVQMLTKKHNKLQHYHYFHHHYHHHHYQHLVHYHLHYYHIIISINLTVINIICTTIITIKHYHYHHHHIDQPFDQPQSYHYS